MIYITIWAIVWSGLMALDTYRNGKLFAPELQRAMFIRNLVLNTIFALIPVGIVVILLDLIS